jgi:hypothetical protein
VDEKRKNGTALPSLVGSVLSRRLYNVVKGYDEHANFLALFDGATGKSRRAVEECLSLSIY